MPKARNNASTTGISSKQDIRSFFSMQTPKGKALANKTDLSDDDVIPESPDVNIKSKKKESRKKRVLNESSDEEIFTSKKSKTSEKTPNGKKEAKTLKEVKPSDLFGSGPIKRTEPLVKKGKKKTETGIHSDEEFEKSLLELDSVEEQAKSPVKIKGKTTEASLKEEKSEHVNGNATKNSKEDNHERGDVNRKSKSNQTEETGKKTEKNAIKINEVISIDSDDSSNQAKELKSPKKESKKEKHHHKLSLKKEEKAASPAKQKDKQKSEKKRDFSEFVDGEDNKEVEHEVKNKRKKLDQSLNSSVLSDEERHERKRHSAILYQNYKNRSGPKNLGAKEMPEGTPDCLKDCAFLLTGVLDSFEREEIAEAIAKYGGTVKSGISKKVTHVLAGEEAGPAKLSKAQDLGIKILNEDEFLQMIRDRSKRKTKHDNDTSITKKETKNDKHKSSNNKSDKKIDENPSKDVKVNGDNKGDTKKKISPDKMKSFEEKIKSSFYKKPVVNGDNKSSHNDEAGCSKTEDKNVRIMKEEVKKSENKVKKEEVIYSNLSEIKKDTPNPPTNSQMWVEKYKPQSVKQIIGQHGEASNVRKLMNWLTKWYLNRKEKIAKPSPWAKNDDGAFYKAALLSGPPGVGKTTTVALVCKELGFDTVEFNASDTRNKTLIREQIGELLTTTSLSGYAKGDTSKKAVSKKHVLVMDEVDGMSGNEDRGGLQELIALIKTSAVPIICTCNDRNSEKMRTLVNYCYDLKFSRPRVDQIKSAMLSVCFKEGLKISPDVLTQLITACNQDVRQTLNSLSLWAVDHSRTDAVSLSRDAGQTKKDTKLGPWEAVRKVFSAEDHKSMSINDKSDLFFYDYSIAPLFVQENYLSVAPHCPKDEVLKRISRAADSISCGDLVEARIRGSQAWNLLPVQAMYSSVIPGTELSGHVAGQIQFPGWLGKNSRANKMKRLAQEIHAHTRLSATGSKSSIYLDYSKHLRDAIVTPLIKEKGDGVPKAIEVLQAYSLLREDLDSLTELALWPGQKDPMVLVNSQVKAAMTRTYNKVAAALPHSSAVSKARARRPNSDDVTQDEIEEEDENSEPENDANIKVKKKTAAKPKDTEKPSSSKGEKSKKGKGKK